jgi:hypothetical protein
VKFATVLGFTAAVAAGYVVARVLIDGEPVIARLPDAARPPVEAVRGRLLAARARAVTVLHEAQRERARAEQELFADYYRRVGRPQPGVAPEPGRRPPVWRPGSRSGS